MRPGRWGSAARPRPHRPHATGLTLFLAAAFAVGLSFAPVPDSLRPFPRLQGDPRGAAQAALFPQAPAAPTSPLAPDRPVVVLTSGGDATEVEGRPLVDDVDAALASLPAEARGRAEQLELLARQVGARHVAIEEGCRRMGDDGCEERALDPFFDALAALAGGESDEPVRVVHLGDSLIASDYITGLARERLQQRYGAAGTGFLFVDRPMLTSGLWTRAGRASEGWTASRLTDPERPEPVGLTGVLFASADEPLTSRFDAGGARYADVLFLGQPGGGEVEVRADGRLLERLRTRRARARPEHARLALPAAARHLSLSTRGRVGVYGVALEDETPGVVYDSLGLPGATARVLLRADEEAFKAQLSQRDPKLVVVMLGGNEAFELSHGATDAAATTRAFGRLVQRVREAAPGAACLLVGPMAAGVQSLDRVLAPRAGTRAAAEAVREAALKNGCAFWDMLSAMGGDAALGPWLDKHLLMDDFVHPRALGGDLLGHLFDVALESAHQLRTGAVADGGVELKSQSLDAARLARVFAKLRALQQGQTQRVAFAQLGASHTAGRSFTEEVRRRLAERFGDAGPGYVGAGKPSKRLEPAGLRRTLRGSWQVRDALEKPGSGPWGLTGVRAEGPPDAGLGFEFCTGCAADEGPSKLWLFWLERPGMGRLAVKLDGETVAQVPRLPARDAGVQLLELSAKGLAHRLEVENAGPGPVAVLGAAAEAVRPGVVYDTLGLPGSTIFTLDGYDVPALTTQLKARAPDLYLTFYGTNESVEPKLEVNAMRAAYRRVFARLRAAAPGADCLIIGPTDRLERQGGAWTEVPAEERVQAAMPDVAKEAGCAFWSAREAMGGRGSMRAWLATEPRLANPDHVHLTPLGYQRLADAFADDLLAAFDAAQPDGGR